MNSRKNRTNGAPAGKESWSAVRENRVHSAEFEQLTVSNFGNAGPLGIVQVDYRSQLQTDHHSHQWDSLHLVLSGRIEEQYNLQDRQAETGSMLFYGRGVTHATKLVDSQSRLIHFPFWTRESDEAVFSNCDHSGLIADLLYLPLLRLWIESIECQFSRTSLERAGQRIGEMLRSAIQHSQKLISLTAYSPTGRLSQWAKQNGLSRGHFARQFRRYFYCSVGSFHKQQAVVRAFQQLMQQNFNLAAVAMEAGFSDQSHMGRAFKTELGMTPGRLRKWLDAALQNNGGDS